MQQWQKYIKKIKYSIYFKNVHEGGGRREDLICQQVIKNILRKSCSQFNVYEQYDIVAKKLVHCQSALCL